MGFAQGIWGLHKVFGLWQIAEHWESYMELETAFPWDNITLTKADGSPLGGED